LNGASDLLKKVLGDKPGHARTVFGYPKLPNNATVELVVDTEIKLEDKTKIKGVIKWKI